MANLSDKISPSGVLTPSDIGTSVQAQDAVLDATTASFLIADESKLDNIEPNATTDQTAGEIEAIVAHDNLQGVTTNEHIDWTVGQGATDIHADNYTDTTYTHPNHTGQVTSTGDGATVLTAVAITAQTSLTASPASTDELLISDAGVLKRVAQSLIGTGKQSVWQPASAMSPSETQGAALSSIELVTNAVQITTMDFDPSVDTHAQFSITAPTGYNGGAWQAIFFWSRPTGTNSGVSWAIQGRSHSNSGALDASWSTADVTDDSAATVDDIAISPNSGDFTPTGVTANANEMINFRVFRDVSDASDDLDVVARLHGVLLTYTTNKNTDD